MSIPQFADTPTDCDLRAQAIQYALSSGASGTAVLDLAQKFYDFLTAGNVNEKISSS